MKQEVTLITAEEARRRVNTPQQLQLVDINNKIIEACDQDKYFIEYKDPYQIVINTLKQSGYEVMETNPLAPQATIIVSWKPKQDYSMFKR